jgi:transcriptional regulator with XRE-family HTH domain
MILKQLRISRHLSQEQLAQMSGLNVRTIQRIESGHKASVESLKCLAAVLEVDISTLNQEKFVMEKKSRTWNDLPLWLKCWFFLNFLQLRPSRAVTKRMEAVCHATGFLFCLAGMVSEPALAGGLMLLATGYMFTFIALQGDRQGIWYDAPEPGHAA